jgi:peptide/nickel transport system substrate-binding protein
VQPQIRLVDDVQYWRRLSRFEFDMIQWVWPASASPGNEQRNRWSAAAADRHGSLNYAGARSPATDAMIEALLAARSREEFVSTVRALDRTLLSGFYVVPLFHIAEQWLAYDAGLKHPGRIPLLGATIDVWWRNPP